MAQTSCTIDKTVPANEQGENLYICADAGKTFKAWCDGSTDAEYKTPPLEKALWSKNGDNEGLEFQGGFIVCRKVNN